MSVRRGLRRAALVLAHALSWPWRLVPWPARRGLLAGLVVLESRIGAPADALRRLFAHEDLLDRLIDERATAYGGGLNPKHRLIRYHDFFVARIPAGSRVLDVGCGVGAVARSIAGRVPGVRVTAVDSDARVLALAQAEPAPPNLIFLHADAARLPDGEWDAIVLSNVLEHLDGRVAFLRSLAARHPAARILVRVPLFERDWRLALRRELDAPYVSDPTHRIEHTLAEFEAEAAAAGLSVVERQLLWGEIWAVLAPAAPG